MRAALVALAGLSLAAASPAQPPTLEPSAAVALAAADPQHDHAGRFSMTVASAGEKRRVTFLDSAANYRAADNLAFSLSENVARELARRIGGPVTTAMIGRTIVVDGRVQRIAIVNTTADGRSAGFNRWAYNVRVTDPAQIVSVSLAPALTVP